MFPEIKINKREIIKKGQPSATHQEIINENFLE